MNKNNMLTRFDEGGLHSQNPLGGIPIGNNNSVEENETKSGNFIYSNRIVLDSNIVSQYNLPKSLIGKSVADATKIVDNKFKGRNDKISQSTKDLMLSKIAEAQEAMKPQNEEIQEDENETLINFNPNQNKYSLGGNLIEGQQFGDTLGNVSTTALDMAFPGAGQIAKMGDQLGTSIGSAIGGSRGESIGGLISPLGTIKGLGAALKTKNLNDIPGIGIFGGKTTAQKEKENALNKAAFVANNKFSEQYALGGEILNSIDPIKALAAKQGISSSPINENPLFNTKRIVKYQPGVTNDKLGRGFYLYSKDNTQPGFDPNKDREFIKQSEMLAVQRTPEWKEYMLQQSLSKPQTTFANGGPIKPKWINDSIYTASKRFNSEGTLNDQILTDDLVKQFSVSKGVAPGQYVPQTTSTVNPYLDKAKTISKDIVNYAGNNIGNLARYAPVLTNALQLKNLQKPQAERLDRLSNRYKSEYVDEAMIRNIVDQEANNQINALTQSGASQGTVRNAILGAGLNKTKALSDAYMNAAAQNRATNDRAQTFNLGVDQVNLNQSNTEKENYARDKGNYDTQKSKLIGQLGNDIGNIGKEEVYKKIAKNTLGYTWDGKYWVKPDGTKSTNEEVKNEINSSKDNKKALGGYLIKNKK